MKLKWDCSLTTLRAAKQYLRGSPSREGSWPLPEMESHELIAGPLPSPNKINIFRWFETKFASLPRIFVQNRFPIIGVHVNLYSEAHPRGGWYFAVSRQHRPPSCVFMKVICTNLPLRDRLHNLSIAFQLELLPYSITFPNFERQLFLYSICVQCKQCQQNDFLYKN